MTWRNQLSFQSSTRSTIDARSMPRKWHVALVAAILLAIPVPDASLAVDLACGMECVGDIAASGWWTPDESPAMSDVE